MISSLQNLALIRIHLWELFMTFILIIFSHVSHGDLIWANLETWSNVQFGALET